MNTTPALPALGQELVPPNEEAAFRVITDVCLALLDTSDSPVKRQQHPWHHGCVRAVFEVASDVPVALRHGVFNAPRRYDALVRFSTGRKQDERKKDAHGIAIKLFGVDGEKIMESERHAPTQDFILLDSPTFFIRNAADYAEFAASMLNGVRAAGSWWAKLLPATARELISVAVMYRQFFRSHKREFAMMKAVRKPPSNPLAKQFWSATPYRLGPHAVHYQLRPLEVHPTRSAPTPGMHVHEAPERMRRELAERLARDGASFDFYVHRQTDPAAMPVEDPTVAWDELVSPPLRVATLHIPRQEFDTPRKRALSETLTFSPFHSLPEHAPMGGINRSRGHVYYVLANRRHELNGVKCEEPGSGWLDDVWDNETGPADRAPVSVPVHAGAR